MASLYQRENSPFWWIKYRDVSGKTVRESTELRVGVGLDTRKARELKAQKTLEESQTGYTSSKDAWSNWVDDFLKQKYGGSPKTFQRYEISWKSISRFLELQQIHGPRNLTYEHVLKYLKWRQDPKDTGVYKCSHNTALMDVKMLRIVMKEAIKRGFATANPCASLGIQKEAPDEKPEMTDNEIKTIRKALKEEPEWMRIAFEIGIHQGCRLTETCMDLKNVDLQRNAITFNAKGHKQFTTALHPGLVSLFKKMKSESRKSTYEMPFMPSKAWWQFFKRIKMKHLCFHCTRVTVVTKLARAGVTESQAMRFVGHASSTVHRIYQRLKVEDLSSCIEAIQMPKAA